MCDCIVLLPASYIALLTSHRKMALDEAEDDVDDAVSDLTQLEEEDEIPDEGEEVESDIEKIDVRYDNFTLTLCFTNMYSPDYVAFTRPSTSPVRG